MSVLYSLYRVNDEALFASSGSIHKILHIIVPEVLSCAVVLIKANGEIYFVPPVNRTNCYTDIDLFRVLFVELRTRKWFGYGAREVNLTE